MAKRKKNKAMIKELATMADEKPEQKELEQVEEPVETKAPISDDEQEQVDMVETQPTVVDTKKPVKEADKKLSPLARVIMREKATKGVDIEREMPLTEHDVKRAAVNVDDKKRDFYNETYVKEQYDILMTELERRCAETGVNFSIDARLDNTKIYITDNLGGRFTYLLPNDFAASRNTSYKAKFTEIIDLAAGKVAM